MSLPSIDEAFHGSVTVGERGQVVIPASAREKLGISPGDKLLVFSHPNGCGVMFAKLQGLQTMAGMLGSLLEAVETDGEDVGGEGVS